MPENFLYELTLLTIDLMSAFACSTLHASWLFVFLLRLTSDFIAERLGHSNFSEVRELDLPHSSLRTVDLGTSDVFFNLRRLANHLLAF